MRFLREFVHFKPYAMLFFPVAFGCRGTRVCYNFLGFVEFLFCLVACMTAENESAENLDLIAAYYLSTN